VKATEASVAALILRELIPVGVLIVSGAILCRLVDSAVPLKWCLALGSMFSGSYFLFMSIAFSKAPNLNATFLSLVPAICLGLGLLIAPVIGGYQTKRASRRKFGRPPD
jgi:hypothetical protein